MKINRTDVARVVEAVLEGGARQATVYRATDMVVRATAIRKLDARYRSVSVMLTIGRPNYRERKFIKECVKAGEPFPVRKVQLRWYPAKRGLDKAVKSRGV